MENQLFILASRCYSYSVWPYGLQGASCLVLPCSLSSWFFSILLALWSLRLGKRELIYVLQVHVFVYLARVIYCPFSLPLGVGGWLQLLIVVLPGVFYKLYRFRERLFAFYARELVNFNVFLPTRTPKMTKPYILSPIRPTVNSSTYREPVPPNQINSVLGTDQFSMSVFSNWSELSQSR